MRSAGPSPASQRNRSVQTDLPWLSACIDDAVPSRRRVATTVAWVVVALVATAVLASTFGAAAGPAVASGGGISTADSTGDTTPGSSAVQASVATGGQTSPAITSSGTVVADAGLQQSAADLQIDIDAAVESATGESLVLLGAFSKSGERSEDVHPVRANIDDVVHRLPGLHFAAVVRHVDSPEGTVRYHARVLESEGHVQTERIWGTLRLFPLATDPDDFELFAAARDDARSRVLRSIGNTEPATVSSLADSLDRAPSTVSHHLDRLEAAELIVRERSGQSVHVSLDPAVRDRLTHSGTDIGESSGRNDVVLSDD